MIIPISFFGALKKGTDWKTNVQFSRELFQVRDKGQEGRAGTETAVPTLEEEDNFILPADDGADEETSMHL